MKISTFFKKIMTKVIYINRKNKAVKPYNRDLFDLYMFDLPDWVVGIENVEVFMDILGGCINTYQPSLPTKQSLSKASRLVYKKNKYTRNRKEQEIMLAYNSVSKEVMKDVFVEYSQMDAVIPYGKWMMSSLHIPVFNLKQVVFVDYMLRHPELFIAMKEIKAFEIQVKSR